MSANLERLVEIALRDVLDPEIGRSVVDLGLIYAIAAAPDGNVAITMTTTTRGCPLTGFLREAVAAAAGVVSGVTAVTVTLTYEPAWEPAMIAAEEPRPRSSRILRRNKERFSQSPKVFTTG